MKRIPLLLLILLLCSFTGNIKNNLRDEGLLKGRVKSVTEFNSYGLPDYTLALKTIDQYDEKGNETAEKIYNKNNSLFIAVKWTYKYDEAGDITEKNTYDKDGNLSDKTVYTYDKNGNITETNRYFDFGVPEEKITYKYDAKSNDTEEISYNSDGITCRSTFSYSTNGDLADKQVDCSNFPYLTAEGRAITDERYDENGCLLEHREYNKGKQDVVDSKYNAYDFDKTGNWIKRTMTMRYHHRVDTVVYKREISYY